MASKKEQLLQAGDASTKVVKLGDAGEVVIRRLKLKERNELASIGKGEDQTVAGLALTRMIISKAMVDPALTPEEVDELPVPIADIISQEIMAYNGWTKEGQAEIRDHFRPAS